MSHSCVALNDKKEKPRDIRLVCQSARGHVSSIWLISIGRLTYKPDGSYMSVGRLIYKLGGSRLIDGQLHSSSYSS